MKRSVRTILAALALTPLAGMWACNAIWGIPEREVDPGLVCDAAGCRCAAGYADCDQDMTNSCEADLFRTETCGACNIACGERSVCSLGTCVCEAGYDDCDGEPKNGCEADLFRAETCGACDVACANALCGGAMGGCFCFPGYGDCDGEPKNGCETSTNDDAQHCGACGHDCLGGACKEGKCQPVVVADDDFLPDVLAIAGDYAYLRRAADLVRVPVMGGPIETLVPGACPRSLAVQDGVVYYVACSPLQIEAFDTKGSTGPTVLVADATIHPAIAVNSTDFFWVEINFGDIVHRTPRAGGPTEDLWFTEFPDLKSLRADDSAVFWQRYEGIYTYSFSAMKDSPIVAFDGKWPPNFGLDAESIYWLVAPSNELMRAPRTGGMASKLTQTYAFGKLAADGSAVYWLEPMQASVRRVNLDGTLEVLATGQIVTEQTSIELDEKAVYWFAGSGLGTAVKLMKVAK